ncbi:DNA-directed RNA polymerase subunit alpha [Candidatus Roizmanbacteria bacterium]|jgi:DNA-directed RNA polymerase subunit alpha|nr:DNA-directed RNA polymerase subunit alpha [Candidatus Roizmanbacteria bacterium]
MVIPNFYTQKIEETPIYGKYIIEPLPLSFGQSIGHALRRTLLSSLKGVAITQVKIGGAPHLFTGVKGIKESVLEMVLNLRQLRFKYQGEGPFKIKLEAKGKGVVTGKDVEGEVEVVDKDLYIAEITDDKTKLEVEAIVEVGVGYVSAEEQEKKEFGFVPVDAFFSPVKKVNFKVEEARVGRKSNLDRLILEVSTDGSVKPSEVVREACELLSGYFNHILSGKDQPQVKSEESTVDDKQTVVDKKLSEIIIDELNLPSRVINALLRENIETVADLIKVGKDKLTTMKGVGKKSIELIEEELKKMDLSLS